jgi:hypothetical protein
MSDGNYEERRVTYNSAGFAPMYGAFNTPKALVPYFMKKVLNSKLDALKKKLAHHTGVLPDFIVIGAQKCGTTSLYNYLMQHPCIYLPSTKEIGYFDRYYHKGLPWYRRQFPSFLKKYYKKILCEEDFVTGEASTGYILNPHALKRIAKTIPHAKLILMLRNPVDRAYSHYQHSLRAGNERLPFDRALEEEQKRVGEALQRMHEDEYYYNLDIAFYAYRATGIYIDQVKILKNLSPPEQILIISTEDFQADPQTVYGRVLTFLNLPDMALENTKKFNSGSYSPMDSEVRKKLINFFRPYNQKLYEHLGVCFDWDR